MTAEDIKRMEIEGEIYRLKEELANYNSLVADITFRLISVEDCKDEIAKYVEIREKIKELEGELNK